MSVAKTKKPASNEAIQDLREWLERIEEIEELVRIAGRGSRCQSI